MTATRPPSHAATHRHHAGLLRRQPQTFPPRNGWSAYNLAADQAQILG